MLVRELWSRGRGSECWIAIRVCFGHGHASIADQPYEQASWQSTPPDRHQIEQKTRPSLTHSERTVDVQYCTVLKRACERRARVQPTIRGQQCDQHATMMHRWALCNNNTAIADSSAPACCLRSLSSSLFRYHRCPVMPSPTCLLAIRLRWLSCHFASFIFECERPCRANRLCSQKKSSNGLRPRLASHVFVRLAWIDWLKRIIRVQGISQNEA